MSVIRRRDFLKLAGAAALGAPLGGLRLDEEPLGEKRVSSVRLGRTARSLRYYTEPTTHSRELGYYVTDSVIEILEEREGELLPFHNPLWYRTPDGWLNAGYVQPVRNLVNVPTLDVPRGGFLAEVTVPFTQAWKLGGDRRKRAYRFPYSTTHWVTGAFQDSAGEVWYRVADDLLPETYLVYGAHLRRVTAADVAPLSPGAGGKRKEVDLENQRVTAFENDAPVFTAAMSSGRSRAGTPKGEFRVERKNPSRHMAASAADGDPYDLPGVPWVCFISWNGVSLHGTYWHNNYGRPQSHGCINLTPQAARWLYRWTDPPVPLDEDYIESKEGTPVTVF